MHRKNSFLLLQFSTIQITSAIYTEKTNFYFQNYCVQKWTLSPNARKRTFCCYLNDHMSTIGHAACHLFFGAFGRQPPRRKQSVGRALFVMCLTWGYAFLLYSTNRRLGRASRACLLKAICLRRSFSEQVSAKLAQQHGMLC
jgi:hypothetical protein